MSGCEVTGETPPIEPTAYWVFGAQKNGEAPEPIYVGKARVRISRYADGSLAFEIWTGGSE